MSLACAAAEIRRHRPRSKAGSKDGGTAAPQHEPEGAEYFGATLSNIHAGLPCRVQNLGPERLIRGSAGSTHSFRRTIATDAYRSTRDVRGGAPRTL